MKRKALNKDVIINILAMVGAVFLGVCYISYLFGGTAVSDDGGLLVSITAISIAVLPPLAYPLLKKLSFFSIFRAVYCLALVLYMVLFLVFAAVVMAGRDEAYVLDEGEEIVVVCGCYTDGYEPSPKLKSRLDVAVSLLMDNPDALCIVSGGMGEDETVSEAESMRNYLSEAGVEADRIIKEENSRDTVENVVNSIEIIKKRGCFDDRKVVFVSNDFHVLRVGMIAEKNGLKARVIAAPSPDKLALLPSLVREFMSYIKYFVE